MYAAIVFLPLLGAIITGFGNKRLGNSAAQWITTSFVMVSATLSWIVFFDVALGDAGTHQVVIAKWLQSGTFDVSWSIRMNTLTAVMLVVVNTVSALVHLYSHEYMHEDPAIPRFQAYLSLFTFAMLMLVTADNFLQLFFGWEGVGLASYLLIGFWFHKDSANAASMKAFVVNRVGDFGFGLGIMAIYMVFGSIQFDTVFAAVPDYVDKTFYVFGLELDIINTIAMLLFIGAMGKSAQLFLHTWLPDAMEGPTPVSALIHAATMVTAGVFMVTLCSPIFEYAPAALTFVTIIGASTAFFAATIGLVQNDIKRVIAYSTCSQLGYMFFALGVSAYPAGMFHLFTHAFFKALLFLGAGSVIHAMHHEQDMRSMGGLWQKIPWTFATMMIGTLAITGVPLLSGFYSKDMIIEAAYAAQTSVGQYAFWMGVVAAFFTSFYSWRLIYMTFLQPTRADHHTFDHAHESPWKMLVPLFVLSAGALGAGAFFYDGFVGHHWQEFWGDAILVLPEHEAMANAHHVPTWVKLTPMVSMVAGLTLATIMYMWKPHLPKVLAKYNEPLYQFLLHKWYFDEIYDWLFVRSSKVIGRFLWRRGDGNVIDGFGPNGLASVVVQIARRVGALQTGYVYHYAFAMLIGITLIVTWYLMSSGI